MLDITCNPRFEHDCADCLFLGCYQQFDIYFCTNSGFGSVIARFDDDASSYSSCPITCALYTDDDNCSEASKVLNKVAKYLLRDNIISVSVNNKKIEELRDTWEDLWKRRKN